MGDNLIFVPFYNIRLYLLLILINLTGCDHSNDPKAAFEQGDYITAYQLWLPLAEKDDIEAQNYLGIHHYLALGVNRDLERARYWFEKAAIKGYPDAQYNLGLMYENGQSVERDFVTAYMWFFAADLQGNKNAVKHMKSLSADHKLFPNQIRRAQDLAQPYIFITRK